jgi:hypothetical protein
MPLAIKNKETENRAQTENAVGALDELLTTSAEMRRLWIGDFGTVEEQTTEVV